RTCTPPSDLPEKTLATIKKEVTEEAGTSKFVSYEEVQRSSFNLKADRVLCPADIGEKVQKGSFNLKADRGLCPADIAEKVQRGNFNLKAARGLCPADKGEKAAETNSLRVNGPNLMQSNSGLEADKEYYKSNLNNKKGRRMRLRRPQKTPPSEPAEQRVEEGQSDVDDERFPQERIHRPLRPHPSSKELVPFCSSDSEAASPAISDALPLTWYEGDPIPQ
ncbi:hypothetical protein HAX54_023466, partial [Datura stramonium]|nr:hypothetical protein [Datura stramonium]